MKSITYIKVLFGAALLMVSCSEVNDSASSYGGDSMPITFSTSVAQLSVETKASESVVVAQGETGFGSYRVVACERGEVLSTRADDSGDGNGFAEGDQIGVNLYYNYWFDENAESVILDNATLTVGSSGEATLETTKLWTFSSIGGDVPTAVLADGYYPKDEEVVRSYGDDSYLSWEYDSTVDLLIASQHYGEWLYYNEGGDDIGAQFKAYIVGELGGSIALNFEHQLATLSFYIYKASDVGDLTIDEMIVDYTCSTYYDSSTDSCWSDETVDMKVVLAVTEGDGTLDTEVPTDPLTLDDDIFLPPNSVINSITFSFVGEADTYTWHPHIVGMEAKNYMIQFELDPERNN